MTSAMKIFKNSEFQVRTLKDGDNIWFVAKDVAQALDYSETTIKQMTVLTQSVPEIWKGRKRIITPGGEQEMLCLSEQGLYFFLGRSDKPKAIPYQIWIAGDVVPDIRKYGMYLLDKTQELYKSSPENFKMLLDKYTAEHEKVLLLQAKIDSMTPKAVLGGIVLALPGAVCFGEAAKFYRQRGLDIGRNRLIRLCVDLGWLCKQKCQLYKPSQKGIEKGVVNIEIDANGCVRFTDRPMLTSKGIQELYKVLLISQRPIEYLLSQGETAE